MIVRRSWVALSLAFLVALLGALAMGCLDSNDVGTADFDAGSIDAAGLDVQVVTTDGSVVVHLPDGGTVTIPDAEIPDTAPTTVTISGTVTGLAGSGLQLENNESDTIAITHDGPFTFPIAMAAGMTYYVSTLTQPESPRQTCVVANGSGTATHDVTDVAITCTTNTYALGGTVVGLAGTSKAGLVLANGSDTVTVDQNGAFTFSQKVASGGSYDVTVKTNPASPAQTCNVSGGTGTIVEGDVKSVVVNCATNAYVVSGTVSGLAGTGLVLHDGADDVPIAANGSFAFPTPIPSGRTYAVSVKTQPTNPSQTCVVSAGSGTITNANVSSVTVACSTNPFPVGGSVSGLSGSGLVLQNNGGETIHVAANGSFAFPTKVLSGQAFSVKVKAQPQTPWQTCAVTNGAGSVGNGPVTSVKVACTTNTYAVGGAASGVAGTGLVLSLNGTTQAPIAGDGPFTFGAPVASGATYAVSVASQPTNPSQTCVVANGQGTIAGGAITNVAVTCTTNTYPVGGTVSGLVGAGLVLTDDGGDAITLAPGTKAFTFKTKIASGQPYDVEVATQPSGPTQTCTVSGNQGTVVAGAVTSVVVNCATSSYAIGGTVTGLAGSGLTLQNGSATLPINANGKFAFPTPVLSGSTYDVVVAIQPTSPSQTCTVANPSGTVGGADVTSVQIACTTNAFPVSGSVSALAGSGLVLEDNGGDDLAIAASGPFTFATKVASGSPYAVTVKTQPTGPWQTCTVGGNGAGTVGNGPVTGVGVTCATNSYAIGGTVSGFAGSGLTVSLNGGSPLAIEKDGPFKFAQAVASGATYSVAIATQPSSPTQTCTVTNAKGTVAGGDVTNVAIACTTNAYAITGTVSGVQGTGLVLTDNGGDAIPIGPGTTSFAFPTKVLSGQTYDVQVATQPSGPTQACSVSGGQGTVLGADVTSIVVNCATKSFTIGGAVSGLTGSGLVLQNGSATVAVSASGGFAFPAPVPSGSTYAVTVKTQPSSPTQRCTVANGSGTVGGANVNDVTVTCTTSTFTIGGTVTGLAGSGLVLQDNGGDDLAVTGSSFTFTTPVASGAGYAVTVKGQPTNPWQRCAVTSGGSGTVGAGPVTNVAITCTTSTFAVGYTVSGLAGSGLVVTLNGAQATGVKVSGTYAFPTKLASGTSYTVAVQTQPSSPSQKCTVTNPKGTIAGADVSVAIACTTNSFSVGGTIGGLQGSGLVLTNGNDSLTIPAGATSFTFPTKVLSGGSYAVGVPTQPSGPTQTCTVTNPNGTVGNGDVSLSVNCSTNLYTISGSVSGLAGSGLQLSDGTNTISVTSGTFAFPALPSGTAYFIQPTAQPTSPWQTCTVINPKGTLTNADVGNIAVRCVTNSYPVSVTISGLSGGGLQISDGVDTIGPTSNTTYTFPTSIASGASYAIAFNAFPMYPWQTCYVSSGAAQGVVGGSAVSLGVYCYNNTYDVNVTVNFQYTTCTDITISDGYTSQTVTGPGVGNTGFALPLASGTSFTATWSSTQNLCDCSTSPNTGGTLGSGTIGSGTITYYSPSYTLYCGVAVSRPQ